MTGPQPGGTALLITVSPEPGKYEERVLSTTNTNEKTSKLISSKSKL